MGSLEATDAALSSIRQALSLQGVDLSDWVGVFIDGDARDHISLSSALAAFPGHAKAPLSLVSGHPQDIAGEMHALPSHKIIAFDGSPEAHFGHPLRSVSLTLRAVARGGVKRVVVSGLVHWCRKSSKGPKGFAAISDHALLNGRNPLVGHNVPEFGTRFPDMSGCYDPRALACALSSLSSRGFSSDAITVGGCDRIGTGRTTATEAIVEALHLDAVAMGSLVPVIICARHNGMKIAAVGAMAEDKDKKGADIIIDTAKAMVAEKF